MSTLSSSPDPRAVRKTILISYVNEDPDFPYLAAWVRALADELNQYQNFDVTIDQYAIDQGVGKWMNDVIIKSDFILYVPTPEWIKRATNENPTQGPIAGNGVRWEGRILMTLAHNNIQNVNILNKIQNIL